MKLLIFILLFGVAVALINQKIVDGVDTTISEIPWQVSIQFLGHVCSGSVIAPQWVLTSASCVAGLSEETAQIRWGSSFHNRGGSITTIENIYINANYIRKTFQADIALIKTSMMMTAKPVQLASPTDRLSTGNPLDVSGWGLASPNIDMLTTTLKKATIPYITLTRCRTFYDALQINLPENIFCAGYTFNAGASICGGDIGGPAIYYDYSNRLLIGIASFALDCGGVGQPSVFTDVRPYRDWINQISGV